MTVLCSAGCFYYYRGNDTQWTAAGACGIRLQLKEWITTVRMNPNSSSLFHNLKISWGFGVSGKPNPSWEGAAAERLMLFLSSSTWFFNKDQRATFQHRICPISEQNLLGVVTPTAHKDPVKGSGGGKEVGVGDLASHSPSFPSLIKKKVGCSSLPTCTSSTIVEAGAGWLRLIPRLHQRDWTPRPCLLSHMFDGCTAQMLFPKYILKLIIFLSESKTTHSLSLNTTQNNTSPKEIQAINEKNRDMMTNRKLNSSQVNFHHPTSNRVWPDEIGNLGFLSSIMVAWAGADQHKGTRVVCDGLSHCCSTPNPLHQTWAHTATHRNMGNRQQKQFGSYFSHSKE